MKKFTLAILALLFFTTAFGQNNYFVKFGVPRDRVVSFVENRRTMTMDLITRDEVSASDGLTKISYHFHEDKLYKIIVTENFFKKKHATKSVQSYERYFQAQGASLRDIKDPHALEHVQFSSRNNKYDIAEIDRGGKHYQVRCISVHPDFAPAEPMPSNATNENNLKQPNKMEERGK